MPPKTAQIRLVSSHPEVYDPCDDSFALVDSLLADRAHLLKHRPAICMEIGCGSGYVITSLSLLLGESSPPPYYIATDINPHAARVTLQTLESHGCQAEVINTDIAFGLESRLYKSVDLIVVNPPYVPTPEEEVGSGGIAAAWAGGENGRKVIDRILPVADGLLSDKGWLYLVALSANDPLELCLEMRKKGYASRIVLQRSTEEESLHVIKFWRDPDVLMEANERMELRRTEDRVVVDFSHFSPFSVWKNRTRDS
ncbi:S-adenosyl-L-methionine-dependent methyltransferases superfamily protein [Striga hermonthica]|uniref:S-adenosyl-L-methionine-dependent methyltransferases superfamily protein n=1 Tax=Striga hermonthica TaxID=68872 RepID=A0A9N7NKE5_STRHE|nr:S-adenosyl-L-methionine-dependent methyltransferases superfamily protein [Striga hermonthica]